MPFCHNCTTPLTPKNTALSIRSKNTVAGAFCDACFEDAKKMRVSFARPAAKGPFEVTGSEVLQTFGMSRPEDRPLPYAPKRTPVSATLDKDGDAKPAYYVVYETELRPGAYAEVSRCLVALSSEDDAVEVSDPAYSRRVVKLLKAEDLKLVDLPDLLKLPA